MLKKLDLELLTFAKQINVPIHLILNKSDKLSKNKIHQSESKLRKELKAQIGDLQQNNISVQVFSASNGSGVLELEDLLCSWLLP